MAELLTFVAPGQEKFFYLATFFVYENVFPLEKEVFRDIWDFLPAGNVFKGSMNHFVRMSFNLLDNHLVKLKASFIYSFVIHAIP